MKPPSLEQNSQIYLETQKENMEYNNEIKRKAKPTLTAPSSERQRMLENKKLRSKRADTQAMDCSRKKRKDYERSAF